MTSKQRQLLRDQLSGQPEESSRSGQRQASRLAFGTDSIVQDKQTDRQQAANADLRINFEHSLDFECGRSALGSTVPAPVGRVQFEWSARTSRVEGNSRRAEEPVREPVSRLRTRTSTV